MKTWKFASSAAGITKSEFYPHCVADSKFSFVQKETEATAHSLRTVICMDVIQAFGTIEGFFWWCIFSLTAFCTTSLRMYWEFFTWWLSIFMAKLCVVLHVHTPTHLCTCFSLRHTNGKIQSLLKAVQTMRNHINIDLLFLQFYACYNAFYLETLPCKLN